MIRWLQVRWYYLCLTYYTIPYCIKRIKKGDIPGPTFFNLCPFRDALYREIKGGRRVGENE